MRKGMSFFGVHVDALTKEQAYAVLNSKQIIFTPNPEILLEASRNHEYREALNSGTLMLPDGHGLQLVSALMRLPRWLRIVVFPPALILYFFWKTPFKTVFPELIHGSDFMLDVVQKSSQEGWSVFFLGAAPGVAEKTALHFKKIFPTLKVAGASSLNPGDEALNCVQISKAEVLFVAYGAPKQELWIAQIWPKLPHLRLAMGVGGSFDFYSGGVSRAPKILRSLGLEWFWRLVLNPMQRAKRIWNAVVVFPLLALLKN